MTALTSKIHPLVLTLYLPSLAFAIATGLLVPVLPLYAAGFEISYSLIGLILAGEAIGTLLGDIPTGLLQQRLGNKQVMIIGMGLTIISTIALFWVTSIWVVFALRLLAGFGRAMYGVSMHIYIANHVTLIQRGKAISTYGGVQRMGGFIGPAIGGAVAAMFGLTAPFLIFGAFGIIGTVMIMMFASKSTGKLKNEELQAHHEHNLNIRQILRDHFRVLASAGTAQLFGQMIRAGRVVIIPLFGADVLGLNVDQIGFIVSISVAVDFSLFYVAGWLMDKYGRKFAIIPCFSIQALGMALIPFTSGFSGLLLASILIGVGNGLGAGTMMTLGADLSPTHSRGEFLGVWRLIGDVGVTGGPLVVGAVADLLMLQSAIFVIAGSGLVAASIFLFFVPETLKRKSKVALST